MKKIKKYLVGLMVIGSLAYSCSGPEVAPATDTVFAPPATIPGVPLPSDAEQGAMLHAHTWPFSSVEQAMADIAGAGFNSVQVSPVNKTKDSAPWWILYQPCDLNIGNSVLGTEAEFRSMCATARNYGVKIIVDVVLNHVGNNGNDGQWADELDPALRNSSYFRFNGRTINYQNRYELTQKDLGNPGLPDWNTQNGTVQQLHIDFLNKCIDAGAGGFRFDAAKHIETSGGEDAGQPWASNYWENVLGNLNNRGSLYLFGEVLPDGGDNDEQYQNYYDITAHDYGGALRSAVRTRDVTGLGTIWHHGQGLNPAKALVYVENHDDYENDQDNAPQLDVWQRKMGYAMAASRAAVTPRLFDRPGSVDVWKDSDVSLINHFRNAMIGQNEYVRYPRQETLVVDRGNIGTAIINLGEGFDLNTPTNLNGGSYNGNGGNFNVSGGNLSGFVAAGAVIVLYNGTSYGNGGGDQGGDNPVTTIYAHYDVGFGNSLFIRGDSGPLSWSGGIQMTNVNATTWMWQTSDFAEGQKFECKVLINDSQWATNSNWWVYGGETVDIYPNF
ncbi:MAG: alpha-amylase family protein [Bacteroidota bacterium]